MAFDPIKEAHLFARKNVGTDVQDIRGWNRSMFDLNAKQIRLSEKIERQSLSYHKQFAALSFFNPFFAHAVPQVTEADIARRTEDAFRDLLLAFPDDGIRH